MILSSQILESSPAVPTCRIYRSILTVGNFFWDNMCIPPTSRTAGTEDDVVPRVQCVLANTMLTLVVCTSTPRRSWITCRHLTWISNRKSATETNAVTALVSRWPRFIRADRPLSMFGLNATCCGWPTSDIVHGSSEQLLSNTDGTRYLAAKPSVRSLLKCSAMTRSNVACRSSSSRRTSGASNMTSVALAM